MSTDAIPPTTSVSPLMSAVNPQASAMQRRITVRAPAKINLHLAVGPRRADGYHELITVFHGVDLFDTVTATAAPRFSLRVTGPESVGLPVNERNLAWRAAQLATDRTAGAPGIALTVDKQIPVAAGLAGGSADAAATLRACDELLGLQLDRPSLVGLAARLGSDVPFSLDGGTALGSGRGELLEPVQVARELHWVLAAAGHGLSTPTVYRELDRQRSAEAAQSKLGDVQALIEALARGNIADIAGLLGNDLQTAALALAPDLSATLLSGEQAGALAGIISGSGPTCVFLASDREHATQIAAFLTQSKTCRFAQVVTGNARTHSSTDTDS